VADEVRIEVRGTAELYAGSLKLADNIAESADDAFLHVADQVAVMVRGRVPRDTGLLAGSVLGEGRDHGALVQMGEGVPYAQYVEYGGRGFPHSPTGNFLYPAAMSAEPLLVATAERTAASEIARMSWPSPG
jgi:Bacteriophage HK97-gp10, putative tail-component